MAIRVLLVDDHLQVRARLKSILENAPDIVVIGEAENGYQALDLVLELAPDVLLLDIEMPSMSGVQVATSLKQAGLAMPVLVVSCIEDKYYIKELLANRAAGYL